MNIGAGRQLNIKQDTVELHSTCLASGDQIQGNSVLYLHVNLQDTRLSHTFVTLLTSIRLLYSVCMYVIFRSLD